MLFQKYPKAIIKELRALYKDFNKHVIKTSQNNKSADLKKIRNIFNILETTPVISIISLMFIKKNFSKKHQEQYNKIILITELYYIGFTLHLNIDNHLFHKNSSQNKTYQVLLGDFLFTKIYEIILSLENHEILKLFAKYNKKISEGMLEIQALSKNNKNNLDKIISTYVDIYGAFIKLCFESLSILNNNFYTNTKDISKYIESLFGLINLHRNTYSYCLSNNSIETNDIKNKVNNNIIDLKKNSYSLNYDQELTNYLGNLANF